MKVLCSHYSSFEIKDAVLEWEVISNQLSVNSGQCSVNQCAPFGVTELGVVTFDVPQVENPTTARLELRLASGENLIAATGQEFYIFPHSPRPQLREGSGSEDVYSPEFGILLERLGYAIVNELSEADVAVVSILDDACREFLLRGGRVLLLAEADDALQTHIPGIRIQTRDRTAWQGDWASSFGWHRLDGLLTQGVVNFAFADLTPEHIIDGFVPRDFALDVYAGLFVGWIHKPVPTIARKRVGRGTLLICTFRLAQNVETNPLAMYLFSELTALISANSGPD